MKAEEAEEYTQALGQIWAGSWRQILWADQQGIPQALGLSTREWVKERLGGYVVQAVPDRRTAAIELTKPEEEGGEGLSNRKAAEILGVDESTVREDKRAGNPAFEAQTQTQIVDEGAGNPAPSQVDLEEAIDAATALAIRDQIDPSGAERQQQAQLIYKWSKAHAALAKKVGDLNSFELEGVAALLDEVGRLNAKTGIDLLRSYCTRMDAALSSSNGLHVVKGGKK